MEPTVSVVPEEAPLLHIALSDERPAKTNATFRFARRGVKRAKATRGARVP